MKRLFQYLQNRYKGKGKAILSFGLFYGCMVAVLTLLFQFIPAGVNLENQLFDKIQRNNAIDSKSDGNYSKYAPWLEQLCFINLDTSFFDKETNRVKKAQLASLIKATQPQLKDAKAVFVDFTFLEKSAEDSLLIPALAGIQEKLILPIFSEIEGDLALTGEEGAIRIDRFSQLKYPVFEGGKTGLVRPFLDPETYINRYFKFKTDDEKLASVPWILATQFSKKEVLSGFDNRMYELSFLLRNEEIPGQEQAVLAYDGHFFTDGKIPTEEMAAIIRDKYVFIGLFGDYRTKYEAEIDKFATPVSPKMSGPLLLANAFLNLVTNSLIRPHSWWMLLGLNIFIGIGIGLMYGRVGATRYTPIVNVLIALVIGVILFNFVATFFFLQFQIKLSLGISLLVFQQQYPLYIWFEGFFK